MKLLPHLSRGRYQMSSKLLMLLIMGVIGTVSALTPLFAQTPGSAIFEKVTIGKEFTPDPLVLEGVSGGSEDARAIAGRGETPTGACVGFVDAEPDIKLTLTDFFEYLKVEVESQADTTIVITGPGGTWCNDDLKDKNPSVTGQWLAGTYSIWVGSYEKGRYQPYEVKISKVQ